MSDDHLHLSHICHCRKYDHLIYAAASVAKAAPRAITSMAVVRAAVAAGQVDVAGQFIAAAEPGLGEHLGELLATELSRRGDIDRALEIVASVADPAARVTVLLAAGLVDRALAVPR